MSSLRISRLLFWLTSSSFIFRLAVGSPHCRVRHHCTPAQSSAFILVAWQWRIVFNVRDSLNSQNRTSFFCYLGWPCVLLSLICTMWNCCTCSHASQCLQDQNKPSNIHTCSFKSVTILTSVFTLTPESRSASGPTWRKMCFLLWLLARVDVHSFLFQLLQSAVISVL